MKTTHADTEGNDEDGEELFLLERKRNKHARKYNELYDKYLLEYMKEFTKKHQSRRFLRQNAIVSKN